uniref:Uncharacterized protein n=1 Tax=Anopheles epiroticus TaxID=199890 RepID=A0A182PPE8_9DIPT
MTERFIGICEIESKLEEAELVHEIAINEKFLLKSTNTSSFLFWFNNEVKNAYWNRMRDELSLEPPCYNMVIQLLLDVKESLRIVLSRKNDRALYTIALLLDEAQLIIGTEERKATTLTQYRTIVTNIMRMACCPTREADIVDLENVTEPVAHLRGIMELLAKMKLDKANYLLACTRPSILQHSIDYERQKFAQLRVTGRRKLHNTMAWLQRTIPSGIVPVTSHKKIRTVRLMDIEMPEYFVDAYQELIVIEKTSPLPELLQIDGGRIVQMKQKLFRLSACAASVQLMCKSVSTLSNHPLRQLLAVQLDSVSKDFPSKHSQTEMLKIFWTHVLDCISKHSQGLNGPIVSENKKLSLRAQLISINSPISAYSILRSQLLLYLKEFVVAEQMKDVSLPAEFQDYREGVIDLARQFRNIVLYNFSVYGSFYLEALQKD